MPLPSFKGGHLLISLFFFAPMQLAVSNPYHSVSPGVKPPYIVTAYIECPMGSKIKYELDKKSGLLQVDRILHSAVHYPSNYGFIPMTYCGDKDPLDILVIGQESVAAGCLMHARPVGGMHMIDQGEDDFKVIAVHEGDPYFNDISDIAQLPTHVLTEIKHFFTTYKELEKGKTRPEIEGFAGSVETMDIVRESIKHYIKFKAKLIKGIYPEIPLKKKTAKKSK